MKSLYTAEYIMWKLQTSKGRKIQLYDGFEVNISATLNLIKREGCVCKKCGTVGTHFKISDEGGLNLFFEKSNGGHVIFTKDHIVPKSRGGINHPVNYQLMCADCNGKKGARIDIKNPIYGFYIDRLFHSWINSFGGADRKLVKKLNTAKIEIKKDYGEIVNEHKLQSLCSKYKLPCPPKAVKNKSACKTLII
jgi:hypothetical protein